MFAKAPVKKIPPYVERKGSIALAGEWLNTKQAITGLLAEIEKNPEDYKSMLSLSMAYIQEGRTTGNHNYYDNAALQLLNTILEKQPDNFDALCCQATVLLSQHHFKEGLLVAQKALAINQQSAFIYGILCDANLELGNYKDAVIMADKMISVRPDIRSYARVSYLREIHGDMPGAIAAMKLAVAAGYPGLEQTEWTRCILGQLYENSGKPDSAQAEYELALLERPDYAYAVAGLGRIAKIKGNYNEAITLFEKANTTIIEYSFADELTDLYYLTHQEKRARQNAEKVIASLGPGSQEEGEEGHGHYADKELAYAYLKINENDQALMHAETEYERRPDNIEACETLAWVKYKQGKYSEAATLMNKALRTNCKNPELLCRAGLIKIKSGDVVKGKEILKSALALNPFLDVRLKEEITPFLS